MKRAMAVIRNVIVGIVVVIAVSMMLFTIISVSTFNRNDRNLFGYKAFIVLSDSMSATDFAAGDLILVKEVDPTTLKEGDIIAYTSRDTSNFGEVVTHKIRILTQDGQGNPGFITYGTTTDVNDETIVTYPYILGKYVKTVPYVGRFFQFLKTTPGYIICILIPFLLLIFSEGLRCIRLFQQYKQEQQEELQTERKQIEEERAQNQKMMEELMALKAQLESGIQNGKEEEKEGGEEKGE